MAGLTEAKKRDAIIRTVIGEAANQGSAGMQAVASVIANRANSGQFGSSDPYVIAMQPNQFSANNSVANGGNNQGRDASENSAIYHRAAAAVDGVLNGSISDPTGGATYYHTAATATPQSWGQMYQTTRVGDHVFYSPHPVPPANVGGTPSSSALGYASGSGSSKALDAISHAAGPAQIASTNAPGQIGHPVLSPILMAENASGSPDDRLSTNQQTMQNLGSPMTTASAGDFYGSFGLEPAASTALGSASSSGSMPLHQILETANAPGQVGQSPASSVTTAFPARPGMVASNGSTSYPSGYGAPANPVHVTPYTPGQSVADMNLNDALYSGHPPTYQSTGGVSDIPNWAAPSVPVSLTTPQPGSSSTVVNGAVNGAIRNAAPQIASALGPVFGTARSVVDNLPTMASPVMGSNNNYGDVGYSGSTPQINMGLPTRSVTSVAINPATGAPVSSNASPGYNSVTDAQRTAMAQLPAYVHADSGSINTQKDQSQQMPTAGNSISNTSTPAMFFDPNATGYGSTSSVYRSPLDAVSTHAPGQVGQSPAPQNYGAPGYSNIPQYLTKLVAVPSETSPFTNPGVQGLSPDDRQALNDKINAVALGRTAPPVTYRRVQVPNPAYRAPAPVAATPPSPVSVGLAASGLTQPQYLAARGYSPEAISGVVNHGGAIMEGYYGGSSSSSGGGSSLSSRG